MITNPSAKYNPEGMSGIINIVLYKNASLGLNGSINSGVTVGKNARYNGAMDLNYRKGKVNLFANYGGSTGKSQRVGDVWRFDNAAHNEISGYNNNTSHLVKLGADVYLNKANTLTVYTTQNLYNNHSTANTLIYFEDVLDSNNPKETASDNYTGIYNLDYTNPLTENVRLELGLETRFRDTRNQYNTTRHQFLYDDNSMKIPDGEGWFLTTPMGSSAFTYDRNIYSAYTNYRHELGKLAMQLGVRVEQYKVDANFTENEKTENFKDDKFTLYPSAFFTYTPGEKNQFQVSYSRRVDRPGINQVNPIRSSWSSPLMVFVGNPELRPQFTNSYEINYTRRLKKGSVSLGTFYRRISDNIIRYTNIDPLDENRVEVTYANAAGEDRYGVEVSGMYRGGKEIIQWRIKPMWTINSGVSMKVFQKKGTISLRVNDIFNTMRFQFESTNFYPSKGGFKWESRTVYVGYAHNFGRSDFKARKRKNRDSGEFNSSGGF